MLDPGSGNDEIRCRRVNATWSWRTRYDALSYTWGDESRRGTILVDGLPLSITENLHSALVHLRHPRRRRVLWVDALCINQDDAGERDEQVKRMGSIYSRARRVVIWLGPETKEVEGAIALIKAVASAYRSSTDAQAVSKRARKDFAPIFALLRRPLVPADLDSSGGGSSPRVRPRVRPPDRPLGYVPGRLQFKRLSGTRAARRRRRRARHPRGSHD